jgi:hypothetical protein
MVKIRVSKGPDFVLWSSFHPMFTPVKAPLRLLAAIGAIIFILDGVPARSPAP